MASSGFNEIDMMILAQLSYHDVPEVEYSSGNATEIVSLHRMLTDDAIYKSMTKDLDKKLVDDFIEKIKDKNYTVVKATNDKDGTGFSALAIEGPDSKTVTVAARGTEGFSMDYDSKKDVIADTQLGLTAESNQQRKMNEFMDGMEKYDSISLTGHSLGGNLAVSGAVCFGYQEKIERVYTYNSPGQNELYKSSHKDGIEGVEDRIINYQNESDMVSDINDPIGRVEYIKTKGEINPFDFENHMLIAFEYDEDGFIYTDGKSPVHETIHDFVDILVPSLPALLNPVTMIPTLIVILDIVIILIVANYIGDAVAGAMRKLKDFISSNFSMGGWYASNNPYILVNTYKLEDYANRISRINNRVDKLDRLLDSLYWKVCDIEDLLSTASALRSLINADILLGYNSRLKKCVQYLNGTAEEFRTAERNINNKMLKP